MRRAIHYWAPLAAWMLVIFAFSSQPHVPYQEDVSDWLSHPFVYMVLAVLASRAFAPEAAPTRRLAVAVFVFCLAYGLSDEWHQSFVPGRHADPWDVLKDGIGSAVGIAIHRAWSRRLTPGEAQPS